MVRAGGGKGSRSLVVTGTGAEEGLEAVAVARNWVLGYCYQIAGELSVPPFWTPLQEPTKVRERSGGAARGQA